MEPQPALPRRNFNLAVIFIVILSILLIVSLGFSSILYYQNYTLQKQIAILITQVHSPLALPTPEEEGPPLEDPVTAWQTYTHPTQDYSFKYPASLTLSEKNNIITLHHSIPYENYGPCDMEGGTKKYPRLTDFNLSFELKNGSIPLDYVDSEYKSGLLKGQMRVYGAEGCGDEEYYFPLQQSKTLVVKKAQIQALSGISNQWNKSEILTVPGVITPEAAQEIFNQILSTFSVGNNAIQKVAPITQKASATNLTYTLPAGWVTARDSTHTFEVGYDPQLLEILVDPNNLMFGSKTGLRSMQSLFKVTAYNGGSRHLFLQEQMGEPLNDADKLPDFNEIEYLIQGKPCLIYDGYSISMSPQVWGMCPISPHSALFLNLPRSNFVETLKTIKFL